MRQALCVNNSKVEKHFSVGNAYTVMGVVDGEILIVDTLNGPVYARADRFIPISEPREGENELTDA